MLEGMEFPLFSTIVLVLVIFSMFALIRNVAMKWKALITIVLLLAYYFLQELYFLIFAFIMLLVFFKIKGMTQFSW